MKELPNFRFVVCVDVTAIDTVSAYKKLYEAMNASTTDSDVQWESSDEWYHPKDDGAPSDPEMLQEARMQAYTDLET